MFHSYIHCLLFLVFSVLKNETHLITSVILCLLAFVRSNPCVCVPFCGFAAVCSALSAQGSEDTYSGEIARVTPNSAYGELHHQPLNDDDELGTEELSGLNHRYMIDHGMKR